MLVDVIYRIADQGIFVGIIIKAGAASLKVADLLFAFPFEKKNKPAKLSSLLFGLFGCWLFVNFHMKFSEHNVNNTTELQSLFVILFFILFIGQLSMQF